MNDIPEEAAKEGEDEEEEVVHAGIMFGRTLPVKLPVGILLGFFMVEFFTTKTRRHEEEEMRGVSRDERG